MVDKNMNKLEKVKEHKRNEAVSMKERLKDYKEKAEAKEEELLYKKLEASKTVETIAERRRLRSEENKINIHNMKLTRLHKQFEIIKKQ